MSGRYDGGVTIFSPKGHLMQIEYAQEAARKGSTAVGIRGANCVVLGVENKSLAKLQEGRTVPKICPLDNHVVMAFAGLAADARFLINRAHSCANNIIDVEDQVSVGYITRYIAGLKEEHTKGNRRRPLGVSCLFAGFNLDGTGHLFETEPSGNYYERKATAIGRSAETVLEFLKNHYNYEEVACERGAVKLVIKALLEVAQSGQKNLEVAVMENEKPLKMLDVKTIEEYVAIIEKEKEVEAEKKMQTN